jgi:neurofibromin 1
MEIAFDTMRDGVEIAFLDHVDTLARFLGDVLTAAAPNLGESVSVLDIGDDETDKPSDCANAWRARWMGLVVGTCFQHNPATQPQAFTVLGYLAADEVDDDLVYQILVAMSTTLSQVSETDSALLNSMLRCLSRVVPGLLPESRYASNLFWLAFAIAEMGYIPLFGAALELMLTALSSLNEDPSVEKVPQHLLQTRTGMDDAARKIDQIAGISFDQEASFCLVAVILKGVRHPSTKDIATQVLMELLRLSVSQNSDSTTEDDAPLIPKGSVAYFAALLAVSANSADEMRSLFVAAGLEVDDASLKDMSTLSVFDLLSIP